MAATDMTKAGLEPGCKINVLPCSEVAGSFSEGEVARIDAMVKVNPWEFVRVEFPWVFLRLGPQGLTNKVHFEHAQRDYEEAQHTRHERFDALLRHYPGDAGVPEQSDTIERFVCVQGLREEGDDDISRRHAFVWGDTFEEAVAHAGGEIFDGWLPEAVFDLDTGERIEVHISSPVITRSEDQGTMLNVLQDIDELRREKAEIEAQDSIGTRDARRLEVIEEILEREGSVA